MKLTKFWFTAPHSSVFGKVRELVGEIKYAFAGLSKLYQVCLKYKNVDSCAVRYIFHLRHKLVKYITTRYQSWIDGHSIATWKCAHRINPATLNNVSKSVSHRSNPAANDDWCRALPVAYYQPCSEYKHRDRHQRCRVFQLATDLPMSLITLSLHALSISKYHQLLLNQPISSPSCLKVSI